MSLPNPVGRQKEVLYLPEEGHSVVLGTAGSGKTTMAILRAAYLANLHSGDKTLLVTFNRALVTYLNSLAPSELDNVDVRTYHQFARGYLNFRGKMSDNAIIDTDARLKLIRRALQEAQAINNKSSITLQFPAEFFAEEFQWMAKSGIRTEEDYIEVEPIDREDSRIIQDLPLVYDVYQRYLHLRSEAGYDYDWDDIAQSVQYEFETDSSPRMYRHIVVDEGQDFSPVMLKSLALAILPDGSLTFFGDMAQQIYGSRISWRSAGLHSPKIWEFKENYRNTKQIAQLGLAISQMSFFQGVPDLVEPSFPKADGPLPTLVKCENEDEETVLALQQARTMGRTQSVAILMRDRTREKRYLTSTSASGLPVQRLHRNMSPWSSKPGVSVGTYHSAKGLEFNAVIIPYCSDTRLPDKSRILALGSEEDSMSDEGRLLYVAVTRAKTLLIITYSGNLTQLLPVNSNLYQELEL